jgi:hypothetical protein
VQYISLLTRTESPSIDSGKHPVDTGLDPYTGELLSCISDSRDSRDELIGPEQPASSSVQVTKVPALCALSALLTAVFATVACAYSGLKAPI